MYINFNLSLDFKIYLNQQIFIFDKNLPNLDLMSYLYNLITIFI